MSLSEDEKLFRLRLSVLLHEAWQKSGLTMTDVALALVPKAQGANNPASYVSGWFRTNVKHTPRPDYYKALGKVLGVDMAKLVNRARTEDIHVPEYGVGAASQRKDGDRAVRRQQKELLKMTRSADVVHFAMPNAMQNSDERELLTGMLSKEVHFRIMVSGEVTPKMIERLIAKLKVEAEILAED